jgi:glycosyltransferase involved in cell wall biosynthesis
MARRDAGIRVTGYVEDVRVPLSRASVVVCPLRFGYGIRGRIFELLSMNVPVVATPIAVAGMELEAGDGLLLAEGADAFAAAVADLLRDPERRAALGQRGREIAVQRMSIAATYDKLVENLVRRVEPGTVTAAT